MTLPKLSPKQKEGLKILKNDNYTDILFSGGARSGKTFLILFYLLCCALKFDGIRFLIARLRFAHVRSNIWLQDVPKFQAFTLFENIKLDRQNYIINIGKSQIWLGGLDDKERTDKILGQEYAGIFLNEAVQIPITSRNLIRTRLAQKINGFQNFLIYDCNPRHPLHYLYQEFYLEEKENRKVLNWSPYDNRDNLPPSYIENFLETLKGNDRKRFLEGIWAKVPGAVYPNVTEENIISCNQDLVYYDDVIGGLDFGLYSAFCLWGIKNDKAYCLREIIFQGAKQTTTDNIILELEDDPEIKFFEIIIYCDHEPDRIQMLENAGFLAKTANKSVEAGDSIINEFELFFDRGCMSTFQSMLNLTHQQDNNGNFLSGKHVKENDHEADAARYALATWKMENSSDSHFIEGPA